MDAGGAPIPFWDENLHIYCYYFGISNANDKSRKCLLYVTKKTHLTIRKKMCFQTTKMVIPRNMDHARDDDQHNINHEYLHRNMFRHEAISSITQ